MIKGHLRYPVMDKNAWTKRATMLAAAVAVLTPLSARADEFQDFQEAREAYRGQDYALAAKRFDVLVGDEPARMQNKPLRLESRKYLGASYLFIKQKKNAIDQFRRLLNEDPDYQLDPLAFPAQVLEIFEQVKKDVQRRVKMEADKKQNHVLETHEKEILDRMERGNRLQALIDLAETERVTQRNSRWIAMLPFGAGQLQNGHEDLGMALAIIQGVLAAMSLTSFLVYQTIDVPARLIGQSDSGDFQAASRAETAWYVTNVASTGLFAAVAAIGIIDAQARFRPQITRIRHRPLPGDVREDLPLQASLSGSTLRLRF
ncbi:MAG: hypothetical protein H6714_02445 [Myxococcales bacterium]|nr:hypothetical protein [Myxococcales bacterium]